MYVPVHTYSNNITYISFFLNFNNAVMPLVVVVNTVSFEKEAYSVNEATGQVEVALVLNEALSTDIAVTVSSTNALATGKY